MSPLSSLVTPIFAKRRSEREKEREREREKGTGNACIV